LGVLVEQLAKGGAADMADKMSEVLGRGESYLVGAGQVVEIVEDDLL
jgi:hypothetical protein